LKNQLEECSKKQDSIPQCVTNHSEQPPNTSTDQPSTTSTPGSISDQKSDQNLFNHIIDLNGCLSRQEELEDELEQCLLKNFASEAGENEVESDDPTDQESCLVLLKKLQQKIDFCTNAKQDS